MASIPVEVIRDIRKKITAMKLEGTKQREASKLAECRAEVYEGEALRLEKMVDGWIKAFPDTTDDVS